MICGVIGMDDGCALTALSASAACALAKDLSVGQLAVLSAFLCSLGDNLAIIAARRGECVNGSEC